MQTRCTFISLAPTVDITNAKRNRLAVQLGVGSPMTGTTDAMWDKGIRSQIGVNPLTF
jgi:hypothetical protein